MIQDENHIKHIGQFVSHRIFAKYAVKFWVDIENNRLLFFKFLKLQPSISNQIIIRLFGSALINKM